MKISFVIPSYNAAGWLGAAVESVRKQSYKDVECVVVNDGSTDSTDKYLKWLSAQGDNRIKIIATHNQGRSVARNIGNDYATGEVICVLDADDITYPKRAEIVAREFSRGAQFLYGSAVVMNAIGGQLGELVAEKLNVEKARELLTFKIVHSTVAYTKDIAKRFPYLGGEISELGVDDFALYASVLESGIQLNHVTNPLCLYRQLETAVSKVRDEAKATEVKRKFLESLKVPA